MFRNTKNRSKREKISFTSAALTNWYTFTHIWNALCILTHAYTWNILNHTVIPVRHYYMLETESENVVLNFNGRFICQSQKKTQTRLYNLWWIISKYAWQIEHKSKLIINNNCLLVTYWQKWQINPWHRGEKKMKQRRKKTLNENEQLKKLSSLPLPLSSYLNRSHLIQKNYSRNMGGNMHYSLDSSTYTDFLFDLLISSFTCFDIQFFFI